MLVACKSPLPESARERGGLHACVVSTVVAAPARFSVCQLKNMDDNRVGVYRVDDVFMGSRVLSIAKGRVLVGDAQELIPACAPDPPRATYRIMSDGPLPVLDATSPQG